MPLEDLLSMDGLYLTLTMVQDRVLQLRLVCKKIMNALETNIFLKVNISITDTGVDNLTAEFLQRWHGSVLLHCKCRWNPRSRWFEEVRTALLSGRLRPIALLSLIVEGGNLLPLVEALVGIKPAIQQLEIAYHGISAGLLSAAAPIAALGRILTMNITVQERDPGGLQTSVWLQYLLASRIRIDSISFRSVC